MEIVAIIPARGGSKGVPQKNIRLIGGKPLVAWSIEETLRSPQIQTTYVTSDCDDILEIAVQYGATPIKRPEEFSNDMASSEAALIHALHSFDKTPDYVVFPQATSPVRAPFSIDSAITQIINSGADSLLSVTPLQDFFIWGHNKQQHFTSLNYDYKNRKLRQDIQETYLENGSFYIFKPEILLKENNRLGGVIDKYLMSKPESHQIDHFEDFDVCEYYLQQMLKQNKEN
jgi:CMP-N,N'-diacetyllegionaminic acid synthase